MTKRTNRGKNRDLYVLPGGGITDRVYYTIDALMEMRESIEAQKARRAEMKTRGAVLTRTESDNKQYFLGV